MALHTCPKCKRKFAGASGLWYHKVHKHGYVPRKRYRKGGKLGGTGGSAPALKKKKKRTKRGTRRKGKKMALPLSLDYCAAVVNSNVGQISVRIFNTRSDDLAWISSMLESEERKTVLGALCDWDLPASV